MAPTHEPTNGELKGLILGLGTQITALAQRVTALEHDRDTSKGDLLREVGGVHKVLERQDRELAKQSAQLSELVDDKKALNAKLGLLKTIGLVVPPLAAFAMWALQHVKL